VCTICIYEHVSRLTLAQTWWPEQNDGHLPPFYYCETGYLVQQEASHLLFVLIPIFHNLANCLK